MLKTKSKPQLYQIYGINHLHSHACLLLSVMPSWKAFHIGRQTTQKAHVRAQVLLYSRSAPGQLSLRSTFIMCVKCEGGQAGLAHTSVGRLVRGPPVLPRQSNPNPLPEVYAFQTWSPCVGLAEEAAVGCAVSLATGLLWVVGGSGGR